MVIQNKHRRKNTDHDFFRSSISCRTSSAFSIYSNRSRPCTSNIDSATHSLRVCTRLVENCEVLQRGKRRFMVLSARLHITGIHRPHVFVYLECFVVVDRSLVVIFHAFVHQREVVQSTGINRMVFAEVALYELPVKKQQIKIPIELLGRRPSLYHISRLRKVRLLWPVSDHYNERNHFYLLDLTLDVHKQFM